MWANLFSKRRAAETRAEELRKARGQMAEQLVKLDYRNHVLKGRVEDLMKRMLEERRSA